MKKLDLTKTIQFQAAMFGLLGLGCGVVYSFGGLVIDTLVTLGWVTTNETPGISEGTLLAFGALIGMPVIGILFVACTGAVQALLYNLIANKIPTVDLDLKQ